MSRRMAGGPDPIDIYVGARVRARRQACGISQEALGERLDVSFQQIQKYERGTNRISASRLARMAMVLDTPISGFFEGVAALDALSSDPGATLPGLIQMLAGAEGRELVDAFLAIRSPTMRRRLVALAGSIAAAGY